jgi:sec-independent protein translocase protein TatA
MAPASWFRRRRFNGRVLALATCCSHLTLCGRIFSGERSYIAMFGIGTTELLVVMLVLLILFGHRLPSLMRSLGQSATSFKQGMRDATDLDASSEAR